MQKQAPTLGRLFTIAANFTDPDAYFLGGGVVESQPEFQQWFLAVVRENTALRAEQDAVEGEQHDAVCLRHLDRADAAPDDANMQSLAKHIADDLIHGARTRPER